MWLVLVGIAVIAVAVGAIWLLKDSPERIARLLEHAREAERNGKFEEACYSYAILEAARSPERQAAAEKVRLLWREHGPFTFDDIGEEMRSEYCSRSQSCGEGYHRGIVGDVRRILNAPLT
jgi:hypothetical protein